ncbi:MAG: sugar phosphate isomerase/epimerase family protein [Actinomycetales bacterium]
MTRRSTGSRWLPRTAGALLASALVMPLALSGASAEPADEPAPAPAAEPIHVPAEQVSIQMFSLTPWVGDAGLEPVLGRLAEIGFQNIEPFGSNFGGYTAEEFRAMTDGLGLSVPSSHYNVDEDTFDETLEYVATLGQEYVGSGGFAAPGVDTYENTLATAATLNRLGERAVDAGVGPIVGHNHDGEFNAVYEHEGEELSAWEILAAETNPEYVTFELDVAWAAHAGVDVPALIEEYGDRIELLHIKDATNVGGEGRPTFTNLGEGEVPLQEILAAAQENATISYYVLEYDRAADGESFVTTGFEYLTGEPAGEPVPPEPIHVPAEQVSIQMFSLIPWVGSEGLEPVLGRLAEIGFQNIEPFGGNFGDYTAEEFRAMTDGLGLSVPSSHYNVDEDSFDETLEYVATLGQEYVGSGGFAAPGIDTYENTLATAETLNRLGERAVDAGVGPIVGHNHDGEFNAVYEHEGEELSAWEILAAETNPEYVTFELDVAWAAHAGVDVPALIEEYGDRIELLHIKDATGLGADDGPTFTNLGEGEVALQEILAAAQEHATIAYYVLEYDMAADGESFVTTGFEYLTGEPAGEPVPPEPIHVPVDQVSIQMFSLIPWVGDAGLEPVLERLSSIGFVNIEPFGGNFSDYTAEEFRAMTDGLGLSVPSSHYNVDEDTFDATLEYVATLGQEYVGSGGFAAPGIDTYENTLATAATLNRLGERAVDAGVGPIVGHNHDGEFTAVYEHEGEELSAWEILAAETNPEYVTFELDVAWAAHAGVDVPALIEEYGDRIELLHIKDATNVGGEGRPTFTNLGEGEVALQEILAAAQEHATIAYYVLEYDMAPEGEDFVTTGFEYLTGQEAGEPEVPEEPTPAEPAPGVGFYLNNGWDANAEHEFSYGREGDEVLVGDWDGDGQDTLAVRRGNAYYLTNHLYGGNADVELTYGQAGDVVLVGDWDGDGVDSFAVRRGNSYFISNTLQSGDAETELDYGRASDDVLVGDYDGDGVDTFTVRRGNTYFISNTLQSGWADSELDYGRASDDVYVGDWDGDETDSFAVRRGITFLVSNSLTSTWAEIEQDYGRSGEEVFVGDWDGNGSDTLGIRR